MLQTPGLIGVHNLVELLVVADSELVENEEFMAKQVSLDACNLY